MALTTNSAYASGTVSSVSGTTFTASAATFSSGHVGRAIHINAGSAEGQTRVITGYTSTTVVTVDHAWDDSPIPGITENLPSSGDAFYVSYKFDDLDDGTNLIKHSSTLYESTSTWSISNCFIYEKNIAWLFNPSNITLATTASLRFGDKTTGNYSENGCLLLHTSSSNSCWSSSGSAGDLIMYGCIINNVRSPNWATTFWRCYRGDDQMFRLVDCKVYGNLGGRFQGTMSAIYNVEVSNNQNDSNLTVIPVFGLVQGLAGYNGKTVAYWHASAGDEAELYDLSMEDLSNGVIAIRRSANAELRILGVRVSEIEALPTYLYRISDSDAMQCYTSNAIEVEVLESDGSAITSPRVYLENSLGTEQLNDNPATGIVDPTYYRIRFHNEPTGGSIAWDSANATDYTPMVLKVRKYGFQPFVTNWTGLQKLATFTVYLADDNVVVASEATAGAYTGITVNGSTETITITSDHTLQEIYDYCQWWSTQSANVQYDVPLTSADGVNFSMAPGWDFVVSSGYTVTADGQTLTLTGGGGFTISGDFTGLISDGTNSRVPITLTGVTDDSRWRVEKVSDGSLIAEGTQSGTGDITVYDTITANLVITAKVRKGSASIKYLPFESNATATTASGATVVVSQIVDPIA